jgi:hypothetical protein
MCIFPDESIIVGLNVVDLVGTWNVGELSL